MAREVEEAKEASISRQLLDIAPDIRSLPEHSFRKPGGRKIMWEAGKSGAGFRTGPAVLR